MSEKYPGSTVLYNVEKPAKSGKLTLVGVTWYVTVVSTGLDKPSHNLFMRTAEGSLASAALFKADPGKPSIVNGKIDIGTKGFWVDIYVNESKTPGEPPFLTLKLKEREQKPVESAPQLNPTMSVTEDLDTTMFHVEQPKTKPTTGVEAFL